MTRSVAECLEWSAPGRRTSTTVRMGSTAVARLALDMVGRWSELVCTLVFPTAWTTDDHTLTVRAKTLGAAAPALVVSLASLDWHALAGGLSVATVSVANRPADGFTVELLQSAANPLSASDAALVGTIVADARGPEGVSFPVAEKCDQLITPRALPMFSAAVMAIDSVTGELRPVAVSPAGSIASNGASTALTNATKFAEVSLTAATVTLEPGRDADGKQKINVLTGSVATANLPTAASWIGQTCIVVLDAALTVTVDAAGAETIDGATTRTLTAQWEKLTLIARADGLGWRAFPPS
jgi:hypothetical protein